MNNQEKYRNFCRSQDHLPLFVKDWYLDAVCVDGRWDAVVIEEGGRIAAALPYYCKKKGPFHYITMPELCKFMGPIFPGELTDEYKQQKLMNKLAAGLPSVDYFYQQFHYDCTNWLSFYWAGFQQQTRYSYRLENILDLESTHASLAADYRKKLRKATPLLHLSTQGTVTELYTIVQKSYQRQRLTAPFSLSYLEHAYEILQDRDSGQIFFARDEEGHIHSAALLAWDRHSAYLLLAGDDPALRGSGSGVFLTWELIRYAALSRKLNCFDFLGSMIEPIERVRRQFGAKQRAYHSVWRQSSKLFRLVRWLLRKS